MTAGQNVGVTTLNQAGGVDNEGNLTVLSGGTVGKITETGTAGALAIYGGTLQLSQGSGGSMQSVLYIAGGDAGYHQQPFLHQLRHRRRSDRVDLVAGSKAALTTAEPPSPGTEPASFPAPPRAIPTMASAMPIQPILAIRRAWPPAQVEITYTLLGDANLDDKVNGTDFNLMAANFNQAVTNGWDEGDFNYDGKVNGSDFVLLADNFNQFASQSAVSAADLAALDAFAAANGISLTSVPEPASMGLLMLGAIGGMALRRRAR